MINEYFTDVSDAVSEAVGQWWFTVVSALILMGWILYGIFVLAPSIAGWFTSTEWNFPLNTITTVGEWFIGAFMLAAANRNERRFKKTIATIEKLEEKILYDEEVILTQSKPPNGG